MSTSIKVVARTVQQNEDTNIGEESLIFSGKAAGVCYMPDDYFDNGIQNEEKAITRAKGNAKSGHHSVFDHTHISMIVKTSKMMCMLLNSIGVYTTSEKSSRYTKMHPKTDLELEVYNKWINKLQPVILNTYPDTDDKMLNSRFSKIFMKEEGVNENIPLILNRNFATPNSVDDKYKEELEELKKAQDLPSYKLAQENARYMISVFVPTAMMYTVSYRQLVLISNYLELLIKSTPRHNTDFNRQLIEEAQSLLDEVNKVIGDKVLSDNKNQYFRFLEAQHTGYIKNNEFEMFNAYTLANIAEGKKQSIKDSYTLVYNGSLAMLAQAQRHRTIRYTMYFDGSGDTKFYVPDIVKHGGFEKEWLEDLNRVKYCTPQATMVRITEQGLFEDFALKCKERMCGRAQLETMKRTSKSVKKFIKHKYDLSPVNRELLATMTTFDEEYRPIPCARCKFSDFTCSEGCQWGSEKALTRMI